MAKGRRREREAAELYERAGYETFRPQESKYGETDMFGLFDMVALGPGLYTHWVQVKANAENTSLTAFYNQAKDLLPERSIPIYMICHDRQGWRVARDHATGYTWVVDEREQDCKMGEGVVDYLS